MRLPNTCSVSFKNTSLSGGDILSRCPNLMASTGAACHGTGKPSGFEFLIKIVIFKCWFIFLLAILIASGVSCEDARSAVRLSVGRDTTTDQIEQIVHMLKSAVKTQIWPCSKIIPFQRFHFIIQIGVVEIEHLLAHE